MQVVATRWFVDVAHKLRKRYSNISHFHKYAEVVICHLVR